MAGVNARRLSDSLLEARPAHVLILSSRAGGGNFSSGEALVSEIAGRCSVRHVPIEDVISPRLRSANFDRHHWLCFKIPFALHLTYRIPLFYWLKKRQSARLPAAALAPLADLLRKEKPDIVVAMNHRAALWAGCLRRDGRLTAPIWAMATDYKISLGWRWIFWDQIDRMFAPVPLHLPEVAGKFQLADIPVDPAFHGLAARPGNRDDVLVAGGAWGLGPLSVVVDDLHRAAASLRVHVACGTNLELLRALKGRENEGIFAYGPLPSLSAVMEKCASVVSRPGALTLSECFAAGRKIFLLKGLPVIEAANFRYAVRHFGAVPFSTDRFVEWQKAGAAAVRREP